MKYLGEWKTVDTWVGRRWAAACEPARSLSVGSPGGSGKFGTWRARKPIPLIPQFGHREELPSYKHALLLRKARGRSLEAAAVTAVVPLRPTLGLPEVFFLLKIGRVPPEVTTEGMGKRKDNHPWLMVKRKEKEKEGGKEGDRGKERDYSAWLPRLLWFAEMNACASWQHDSCRWNCFR